MHQLITLTLLLMVGAVAAESPTSEVIPCGLTEPAEMLAQSVINHEGQNRTVLDCDADLSRIAHDRAKWLLTNDPDVVSANIFVMRGGFRLANFYPIFGNHVEARVSGQPNPEAALKTLLENKRNQNHILGKGEEVFERQDRIGVGFAEGEHGQHQWVVLMGEIDKPAKIVFKQEFNAPYVIQKDCDKDWEKSNSTYLASKCGSMSNKKRKRKKPKKPEGG